MLSGRGELPRASRRAHWLLLPTWPVWTLAALTLALIAVFLLIGIDIVWIAGIIAVVGAAILLFIELTQSPSRPDHVTEKSPSPPDHLTPPTTLEESERLIDQLDQMAKGVRGLTEAEVEERFRRAQRQAETVRRELAREEEALREELRREERSAEESEPT